VPAFRDKAQQCEDDIFAYHLQDGLLIGQRVDPTGKVRYTNENSGYRTGCLLSSLAHKWSLTADLKVRQRAHQVAAAVEMLEQITGVPGMTTRQYKMMQGPGQDEAGWLQDKWHQVGLYRWQDNVSTDEMTWYLTGLGDYVGVCAEGEHRRRASGTVRRVVGRMLDHGMRICYADGTTTTWGDCSRSTPKEPIFCLHGLAYLKAGELFGLEERSADAYDEYVADEVYLDTAVHCYKLGAAARQWATYDWQLAAPDFERVIKFDKDPRRRDTLKQGVLEMTAAPDCNVFPHLCAAILGLGGADKVREWLTNFDTRDNGIDKGWYHWVYWKARAAGIITEND